MTVFTTEKSLSGSFQRVRIDENDLARLSHVVSDFAGRFEGSADITIVSADGEETIRTKDPGFFVGEHMPPRIRSVSIAYHDYKAPVSCLVSLKAFPYQVAVIEASGTQPDLVSGIYRELDRELKSRQAFGPNIPKFLDSLPAYFFTAVVAGAAVFALFDFVLNIASARVQGFRGSAWHQFLVSVGEACTLVGAFAMPFPIRKVLLQAFPIVEFAGRLSDPNARPRSRLIALAAIIVLPLVLDVLSGLIVQLFTR